MTDLKLSKANHDLVFEDTDLKVTTSEDESLAQRLKIKLFTFKGEFFLNENLGIPYYQRIFQKGTPKETVDIIFKRAISSEPDVLSITEFNSTLGPQYRNYRLDLKVKSASSKEVIPVGIDLGDA